MKQAPKSPTRRELERLPRESLHVARNATKADVYKLEWPPESGNYAVLKDMKRCPAWFRLSAGRYFLWREFRALRALEGTPGVPRALGKPDRDCVLMEWRDGTPVMEWKFGTVPLESLEEIARIIANSHDLGVIHGDLHRSNVLLTQSGQVTLIDWATAGVFSPQRSLFKRWTFGEWVMLDRRAVAKLKARHAPKSLSETEKDVLLNGSKLYRLIRGAGFWVRHKLGHKRAKPPTVAAERYQAILKKQENGGEEA